MSELERADPIIRALIDRLPPVGSEWPEVERRLWLDAIAASFALIYPADHDSRTVSGQKHANRS